MTEQNEMLDDEIFYTTTQMVSISMEHMHNQVSLDSASAAYTLVNWVSIGSHNGLSPIRRQVII